VAYGQTTPYLPFLGCSAPTSRSRRRTTRSRSRRSFVRVSAGWIRLSKGCSLFSANCSGFPTRPRRSSISTEGQATEDVRAIRTLIVAGSRQRLHVLLLEDLHWIDTISEDFLAFLAARLGGVPVLVLTTQRPGYTVRWADKTYYTQIALDLLGEATPRRWWPLCSARATSRPVWCASFATRPRAIRCSWKRSPPLS
jgi:hypothetical protein